MADTTFVDGSTTVVAAWLNDANTVVYTTVPAHTSTLASGVVLKDSTTGAATLPSGTTAQRPAVPVGTLLRYNTTLSDWEGYNGTSWGPLASGFAASGANNDITSLLALTAGGLPDNSVLTNDIANAAVTPAKLSQPPTLGTVVATPSGTTIDFTGIPSWANEITIPVNAVSTSGSSNLVLQLGATTIETSGYSGANIYMPAGSATQGSNHSTAFTLFINIIAASVMQGLVTLTRVSGNTWAFQSSLSRSADAAANISSGVKTLAGALDRVRLTTAGGTDTFDAGSVNILYK